MTKKKKPGQHDFAAPSSDSTLRQDSFRLRSSQAAQGSSPHAHSLKCPSGDTSGLAGLTLRERAEEKARAHEAAIKESLVPEEVRQVLHELRVHQIELEMQNEELRRAQEELEASRARYFDLYNLAPIGYLTLSDKGLITETNLTAAALFGVARSALVKRPLTRFVSPEDRDIYYGHRRQLFETGVRQAFELRIARKGADPFWVLVEMTAAQDSGGAPVCRVILSDISGRKLAELADKRAEAALLQANDELEQRVVQRTEKLRRAIEELEREVTERKRAEESLRASEERFRKLFEHHSAVMLVIDPDTGNIIDANKAAADFYGWSIEELEQMRIQQINTLSPEAVKDEMEKTRSSKGLVFEFRHRRADGSIRDVEVLSNKIKVNGKDILYSIVHDITERKLAEHRLKERMKELQAFYRLAELVERKGITLDELFQEFANVLPQSWQCTEIACARIVIGDSEFHTENFMECAWRQCVPIKVAGSVLGRIEVGYLEERPEQDEGPFLQEERLLINAIAERLGHITERKRAEEELHNLHKMLRQLAENAERAREEERSAIAREVHDEIGQILTALKMDVSSLVRAGLTDPSSVSKRSESMHSIIDHGIKAVQQLSARLRPRVLDDLGLIAALEWQADDFQKRTGIHCSLDLPKREAEVDPKLATAIFRIFQERLTNIARHSNARNVTIAFALKGQKLILAIQDDGVGISRSKISDSSSFGLIGIRERLRPYRGRLGFEWPQEGGTLARVTIPYPNNQEDE